MLGAGRRGRDKEKREQLGLGLGAELLKGKDKFGKTQEGVFTALREGRLRDYRSEDCGEEGADGENLV